MPQTTSGRTSRRALLVGLAALSATLAFHPEAYARRGRGGREDDNPSHENDDVSQAREAVQNGEALPLSDIMAEVNKVIDGEVLDVELLREGAEITYRIRILSPEGRYHRVLVDAKTKTILKIEQQ